MTEWTWEYLTSAEDVVGGLDQEMKARVERLAQRLADAAGVKYPSGLAEEGHASPLMHHAEGRLMLWYMEQRRLALLLVVRVSVWPPEATR